MCNTIIVLIALGNSNVLFITTLILGFDVTGLFVIINFHKEVFVYTYMN